MPLNQLIDILKKLYEAETGWGDSIAWTNQDFINLSERIQERTGIMLSHVTLKRIWGKVKYDSLPNTYTLDTLVQYLGYAGWRNFTSAQQAAKCNMPLAEANTISSEPDVTSDQKSSAVNHEQPIRTGKRLTRVMIAGFIMLALALVYYFRVKPQKVAIDPSDYRFSSKKVVTSGLPNSVIFNYDASASPKDSVMIQQSWDKHRQVSVSKNQHQHTSIYYYPDFYQAKLIVNNQIIKRHELLIQSNGWLPLVEQSPVPVYFSKTDVMKNGKMALSDVDIEAHNIHMQPDPPYVLFSNVKDFGEIYSDDFTFETSLKNDYHNGAAICQQTKIYLLCKNTAIWIPLCKKGCISSLDMLFTNFSVSGKTNDLSMFGVDFSGYVKVKIISHNRKAQIFINDKPVYAINSGIIRSKIIGIDFRFQGTGSVDYVRLGNDKVKYADEF